MKFEELKLGEDLLKAVEDLGFVEPTTIQKRAIPPIREGRDLIAQSETGSGKTAAFGLPMVEKVKINGGIQALVLAPTRELAEQVARHISQFSQHKLTVASVYGGVSIGSQVNLLAKAEIVVATPGRLLDHMQRKTIGLSNIRMLVLDEADKMFEMGFVADVRRIISHLPKHRQTLLFSATIDRYVKEISRDYMRSPLMISANQYVDKKLLKQKYYEVMPRDKFSLLVHLIEQEKTRFAIVFCATRRMTDIVARNLNKNGIEAEALHGGHEQSKRNRKMENFKKGKGHILVATDVAARGLDIKNISHLFNYDMARTTQDYIHRIGRTARAGSSGTAISLISEHDHENFRRVLSDRTIEIQKDRTPIFRHVPFVLNSYNENQGRRRFNRARSWKSGMQRRH